MNVAIVLDSVILIDHLNGHDVATRFIAEHEKQSAITFITYIEVMVGVKVANEILIRQFLGAFPCIMPTTADLETTIFFRKTHRLKLPDALQAAMVVNHRLRLATRKTKDFSTEHHSFVWIPYEIS